MKSILYAIYLALLENLNVFWYNTKYMYFSFERQKLRAKLTRELACIFLTRVTCQ